MAINFPASPTTGQQHLSFVWDGTAWTSLPSSGYMQPFGTMRQSAVQAIPNAGFTAMSWANRTDVTERSVTAGSAGFTIIAPGIYSINATPTFATNATGQRHSYISVNGTNAAQGASVAPQSQLARLNCSAILSLAAGDVVNVSLYQNSGAALNTDIGDGTCTLTIARIASA